MNFLYWLYDFFFWKSTNPKLFGWFHIISLAVLALCILFVLKKLNNLSDKQFRKLLFYVWIFMMVGEVYREVCFSLSLSDGEFSWNYAWYLFPFQMCSSPLYALPFVIYLPTGRVRDGFMSFLATFSMFGGISVMIYAIDVYTARVGSNIQSMTHHGLQILIAILIILHCRERVDKRFFLRGVAVYAAFLTVAMTLNLVGYHALRVAGKGDVFNMFYISPYFDCTLPILSSIQKATSYWVILPIYVFVFVLIAFIIYSLERLAVSKSKAVKK